MSSLETTSPAPRTRRWRRVQAVGGIAGPVTFIAAWARLGARRNGYSPVDDPISRLAEVGSWTRPTMTVGFLAFGVGVGLFAPAVGALLGRGVGAATATAAAASVGIALLPVGSALGDEPHAAAAGVAYAALTAMPLLGARALVARGRHRLAGLSVATGIATGTVLTVATLTPTAAGLAQRLGLTIADAWIIVTAAWVWRTYGSTAATSTSTEPSTVPFT